LREEFRPIAIRHGGGMVASLAFALRTCVDLQLLTCLRFVMANRKLLWGDILDVGCGEMPYRHLLPKDANYTGIDIADPAKFDMTRSQGVIAFNGRDIPFPDASFDSILCTEVLEHVIQPVALIAEMRRVLRPGGTMVVTVPFSARVHYVPYDFHRFTRFRLKQMFWSSGKVEIEERGNDIAVIANKIIVATLRQASLFNVLRWPLFLLGLAATAVALPLAHLTLWLGWGSRLDPLGYGVVVRKR
jgi:SAM-dependent methyltransferase